MGCESLTRLTPPSVWYTCKGSDPIVSERIRTDAHTAEKFMAVRSLTVTLDWDAPNASKSHPAGLLRFVDGFSGLVLKREATLPSNVFFSAMT